VGCGELEDKEEIGIIAQANQVKAWAPEKEELLCNTPICL